MINYPGDSLSLSIWRQPISLSLSGDSLSLSLSLSLSGDSPSLHLSLSYLLCGLFLKHPYKRFCFFIFFIFTHRDFSRTMVRRVWRFLLPADHRNGGLICHCPVAWSPWFYISIINRLASL